MREYGVPGITGVDTRALTQLLRDKEHNLVNSPCWSTPGKEFHDPNTDNLVGKVSCTEIQTYGEGKHIAIVDTGMKLNILRSFLNRGMKVTRFPWNKSPFDYETETVQSSTEFSFQTAQAILNCHRNTRNHAAVF